MTSIAIALAERYRIERELGAGGMATVYLAHDVRHDRKVAVKVLRPELAAALGSERFLQEIRTTANLQHPHILPLFDSGEAGGFLFYVMPYVEGESLRQRLARERQLPVNVAVSITREVAAALDSAHRRGVVHRDIKPENILLAEGSAVVADFGIARAVTAAGGDRLTTTGIVVGTPEYMSPEQASGEHDLDGRSDVYALGCLLYEMLAGEPPFTGPTVQSILAKRFADAAPSVRRLRNTTPAHVDAAIHRALAKTPADRFGTTAEFAAALERSTVGSGSSPAPPMVAVLPFANLSSAADDEYFSDGMTEDIIAQLSQIASLRVISRTSAMQYKKSVAGIKEIAAALGATHVVEGSVRRAGDRLRIVAQLIDASSDAHLWAQTFDREGADVFAIQSELAECIAGALQTRLAPDERRRIARTPTKDQEAYNLYLLARHHANLATADGLQQAMDFYNRAVTRDPQFARAWAALASAQLFHLAGYYGVRPRDAAATLVQHASRALELDPDIAEAHSALGNLASFLHFDWTTAGVRHEQALRLAPNLANVHLLYGNHLVTVGRFSDAVEEARQALELDPASEYVHVHANWLRYATGQLDEALAALEPAEAQFGPKVLTLVRGATLISLGRASEAVEPFRELYGYIPINWHLSHLAWGLAAAGQGAAARAALCELHEREAREYVYPQTVALAYAHLGDMDRAFSYLERCYEDRASWICMPFTTTFEPFRSDPRFDELVRRIGAIPPIETSVP